jgi:hypothetical protein
MDLEHCLHWLHLEPTHLLQMVGDRAAVVVVFQGEVPGP